jgi:hypothetical protein
VWLALCVGTFGFAGVFAVYSYVEPMMTHVAGYSVTSVDWLLALFGVGMTVGNLIGGRLADRALMPSLYATLGALGLLLALFVVTAHHPLLAAVTLFMIGAAGMACVPIIQTRIMDVAHGAPTLAAAANHCERRGRFPGRPGDRRRSGVDIAELGGRRSCRRRSRPRPGLRCIGSAPHGTFFDGRNIGARLQLTCAGRTSPFRLSARRVRSIPRCPCSAAACAIPRGFRSLAHARSTGRRCSRSSGRSGCRAAAG